MKNMIDGFMVENVLGVPIAIIWETELGKILPKVAASLSHKNEKIILDLLLRNGASDRFFEMQVIEGKPVNSSCKPVALSQEQFEKVCNIYKENPDLLDYDCGKLNQPQKFLLRKGSIDQLFRNYCYFERKRGTL